MTAGVHAGQITVCSVAALRVCSALVIGTGITASALNIAISCFGVTLHARPTLLSRID